MEKPDCYYIRSCAAMPEGYVTNKEGLDRLIVHGLITPSYDWPGDWDAVYDTWDEDDQTRVARRIYSLAPEVPWVDHDPA